MAQSIYVYQRSTLVQGSSRAVAITGKEGVLYANLIDTVTVTCNKYPTINYGGPVY